MEELAASEASRHRVEKPMKGWLNTTYPQEAFFAAPVSYWPHAYFLPAQSELLSIGMYAARSIASACYIVAARMGLVYFKHELALWEMKVSWPLDAAWLHVGVAVRRI
ncbi:hypothetical protein Dimus_018205 [Dionaea muscipula]